MAGLVSPLVALGASFAFVFAVLGVAQVLLAHGVMSPSMTRKVVHIGVSHWWIIAMLLFDSLVLALIGPVTFIVLNAISVRTHLFRAMEHSEPRRNLGTVYFPIALTMLVLLTWSGLFPRWYGLAAILVLGWGDGAAAIVGESFGGRPGAIRFGIAGGSKSLVGTLTMAVTSGAVAFLVVWLFTGLLAGAPEPPPGAATAADAPLAGFRVWLSSRLVDSRAWLARPTASVVLGALGRLDALVRALTLRALELAGQGGVSLWQLAPTHVLALAVIIGLVAAASEAVTPWGLDNLTVPLFSFAALAVLIPMPGPWLVRIAWALAFNVAVAGVAFLRRYVTAGGAIAGAAIGFVIYLSGGAFFWSVLMAFFFSSSLLSKVAHHDGADPGIAAKGSRRDAVQALANGGLAAVMALLHAVTGRPLFMLGFAIALAAANADTWASEIGRRSRNDPRSILTFRRAVRGTSGAVSALGLVASAAGSLFIGLWFAAGYFALNGWNTAELAAIVAAITAGGFLGSIVDSVLGATIQAQYRDARRGSVTERAVSADGVANVLVRGFGPVTNDAVNALSGLIAAGVVFGMVLV